MTHGKMWRTAIDISRIELIIFHKKEGVNIVLTPSVIIRPLTLSRGLKDTDTRDHSMILLNEPHQM